MIDYWWYNPNNNFGRFMWFDDRCIQLSGGLSLYFRNKTYIN